MNKKAIIAVVVTALGSLTLSAYNDPYFHNPYKLSLDEKAALAEMNSVRENINDSLSSQMYAVQQRIDEYTPKLSAATTGFDQFKAITDYASAAEKTKQQSEPFAIAIGEELESMPEADVLTYAPEKKLSESASSKKPDEAKAKLAAKTREAIVKAAKKGKYDEPEISQFVSDRMALYQTAVRNLETTLATERAELASLEAKLIPAIGGFDMKSYTKLTGKNTPPVVKTYLPQDQYEGSYADLYLKLYGRGAITDTDYHTATAKFDGVITDELTIFPVESSRLPKEEYESDYTFYKKAIVKSKYGTVPDLIISSSESDDYGLNVYTNIYEGRLSFSGSVQLLNEKWSKKNDKKAGLLVSFHPMESTASIGYTYVLENGKWVNKAPLDPRYMSFKESVAAFGLDNSQRKPGTPKLFSYCEHEYTKERNLELYPFRLDDSPYVVFKTSDEITSEPIFLPKDVRWYIAKDNSYKQDDTLVIEYRVDKEGDPLYAETYKARDGGPDGWTLNNVVHSVDMYLSCTGKLLPSFDSDKLVFVPNLMSMKDPSARFAESLGSKYTGIVSDSKGDKHNLVVVGLEHDKDFFSELYDISNEDLDVKPYDYIVYLDNKPSIMMNTKYFKSQWNTYTDKWPNGINSSQLDRMFSKLSRDYIGSDPAKYYSEADDIDASIYQYGSTSCGKNVLLRIGDEEYVGKIEDMRNEALPTDYDALFGDPPVKITDKNLYPDFLKTDNAGTHAPVDYLMQASVRKLDDVKIDDLTLHGVKKMGDNYLVTYSIKTHRGRMDPQDPENMYDDMYMAILDPKGAMLDAIWMGNYQPESFGRLDGELSIADRISDRRIQNIVTRTSDSYDGRVSYAHRFEYIITNDRFILDKVEWSVASNSDENYVWYRQTNPAPFMHRFPISYTPYSSWKSLARSVDGEYAEGFGLEYGGILFQRNPADFIHRMAKDANDRKNDSITLLYVSDFEDYENEEEKASLLKAAEQLKNSREREVLTNYIKKHVPIPVKPMEEIREREVVPKEKEATKMPEKLIF